MSEISKKKDYITFKGAACIRQALQFSILSGKPVKISEIRSEDLDPGVNEYEMNLLKLIEKVTNGSIIDINVSGTQIRFTPGVITNNNGDEVFYTNEEMQTQDRCLTYYLEFLLPVVLFGKASFYGEFTGITNDNIDMSADTFRNCLLPMLKHFGVEGATMEIKKRGLFPKGGGHISITVPYIRELNSLSLTDEGKVKKIRGTAYCCMRNNEVNTRVFTSARGILNDYIPDVYIYTDNYKKDKCGLSKGFGASLVAETTTECLISADAIHHPEQTLDPEKLGESVAISLLEQIFNSGVSDVRIAPTIVLLMGLSNAENTSEIKLPSNIIQSDYMMNTLRYLNKFFSVKFKISECEDDERDSESDDNEENPKTEEITDKDDDLYKKADEIPRPEFHIFSCLGFGLQNMARKTE
ncbi:unnamed protein product [Moneuplotes crassus]|uniref:RNA 3'-terminal phosphate cyclase-like protein n=1 Tax=Euplotes crassus TaxID=5936 RepID=A0AAD1UIC5_EUPCR|nr:unnamed protein product [Moneuplotes crassus]